MSGYNGCVHNPLTSNVTGSWLTPCAGPVRAYVNPSVLELQGRRAVSWQCEGHAGDAEPWPTRSADHG
jgi:hypothetical protein